MACDTSRYTSDAALFGEFAPVERTDDDFRRGERLAVLGGAAALGAMIGFGTAMSLGRLDTWMVILAAAPLFLFGLYLSVATMRDAMERRSYGCAGAATLFFASLIAWPSAAMFFPISAPNFWIAPMAALSTLVLFASCWGGSKPAIYRACVQSTMVVAAASYLGVMGFLGT